MEITDSLCHACFRRDVHKEGGLGRLLIMASEPGSLDAIARHLKSAGYDLVICMNRSEMLHRLSPSPPDLVVADFRSREMNWLQLLREIRSSKQTQSLPVIFLVDERRKQDRIDAYIIGGDAVVTKPIDPEELVAIVKGIVSRVERSHTSREIEPGQPHAADLTLAEKRVAIRLAQGLMNKEIAKQLGISLRTVENHISRILFKKGFKNRVEIARYVYETRLTE